VVSSWTGKGSNLYAILPTSIFAMYLAYIGSGYTVWKTAYNTFVHDKSTHGHRRRYDLQEEGEAETFAYKLTLKLIILTDRPRVLRAQEYFNNVTIFGVTIDGVWIGDWIYWPLTTSNYSALANSYTHLLTTAHTKSSKSVFTRRFLVKDPNNVLCLCPYWLPNVS
jgi:hypothetical protein